MKFAGVMLLLAGWIILLAAVALLASPAPRAAFVLAGMAVEVLGLAILFRSNFIFRREGN
jgi:membrane-bound ClpP family serine protease